MIDKTHLSYLQIIDDRKDQPPFRKKCMESLRCNAGDHKIKVITIPYNEDRLKMVRMADEVRLKLAYEDGTICYVDTDVFISKPLHELEWTNSVPYFAGYNDNPKYADIYYFYVNGQVDYFKENLPLSCLSQDGYSVKKEALFALENFAVIPPMTYFHVADTISKVIESKQYSDALARFAVVEDTYRSCQGAVKQMAITFKMSEQLLGSIRK